MYGNIPLSINGLIIIVNHLTQQGLNLRSFFYNFVGMRVDWLGTNIFLRKKFNVYKTWVKLTRPGGVIGCFLCELWHIEIIIFITIICQ